MQMNFLQMSHRFRVSTFLRWRRFYYFDCRFLQNETIHSNIICQLSSLFAMKERNSALPTIFATSEYFSNRVVATCQ
jgi:hypothetical protein